jgi:hypothetical protein
MSKTTSSQLVGSVTRRATSENNAGRISNTEHMSGDECIKGAGYAPQSNSSRPFADVRHRSMMLQRGSPKLPLATSAANSCKEPKADISV